MNNKRSKGMTPALVLVLIGLLVLIASAGAYYFMKMQGKTPSNQVTDTSLRTPQATGQFGISDSDDLKTIEAELDATVVGSVETDLKELDSNASGL